MYNTRERYVFTSERASQGRLNRTINNNNDDDNISFAAVVLGPPKRLLQYCNVIFISVYIGTAGADVDYSAHNIA